MFDYFSVSCKRYYKIKFVHEFFSFLKKIPQTTCHSLMDSLPVWNYKLKVLIKDTELPCWHYLFKASKMCPIKTMCEICSKLKRHQYDVNDVILFFFNFEHCNSFWALLFHCWLWTTKCRLGSNHCHSVIYILI